MTPMRQLNDRVVIVGSFRSKKLATVTKVTKTGQFETDITGDMKFCREGRQIGGDSHGRLWAHRASQQDILELEEETKKSLLTDKIFGKVQYKEKLMKLDLSKLERIQAILEEA